MPRKTSEELVELTLIREEIVRLNSKVESLEDQLKNRVTYEEYTKFKDSCGPVVVETLPLLRKLEQNYESLRRIIYTTRTKERLEKEAEEKAQKQFMGWCMIAGTLIGGGSGFEVLKHFFGAG